ncbi:ABC transporter permease [Salipiger abyssi]|uniref:ABC transporter permease n=1 Tax=Salipiger abyssi TaxID=1250539 RepID=UPI001A8F4658|nr:ABC transporter permease [Salipiger abyssi]MBN9887092.1 ABC transporter permease [Salipiger abyssi]
MRMPDAERAQLRREGLKTALLMAPAVIVFIGLFVAPLAWFFVQSFWRNATFRVVPDFQFGNYATAFRDYGGVLLRTLGTGLEVGGITTVLAFFFAYAVRFALGRAGPLILVIALTTLFGGYVVKVYAWRSLLGLDGILNGALMAAGLTDAPVEALLFNAGAVTVTLTHYLLPLAILPLYGALADMDETVIAAARDSGASAPRTMFDIVLPQIRPALIASFAMSFLLAAGDYVTPALVGSPGNAMYGNFIQSQFGLRMNTPLGAAMSFSLLGCCLLILATVWLVMRRVLRAR